MLRVKEIVDDMKISYVEVLQSDFFLTKKPTCNVSAFVGKQNFSTSKPIFPSSF